MRIGLDARMYRSSTGGIGTYSQQLIRHLARLDQKNQYFVFLTKEDLREYDVRAVNFKPVLVNIPHYSLWEQLKLPSILRKYRLDLVHFLHFNHPIFYKGRFVVSIHDLTITKFPAGPRQKNPIKYFFYREVMVDAIKRSIFISSLSQATKNDLLKKYSIKPTKVKVVPLATDRRFKPVSADQAQPILEKYRLKKPYILFVSQWRSHKGINYLLKAMELLRERFQQKELIITMVGCKSNRFPGMGRKVDKAKRAGLVQTSGFVEKEALPAIYSQAEVFVFPSLYEGFGLPPLEAMACGTPVASSNLSCMPEVLGPAPLYFDPRDPADIALKINTLLTNQKLADRLIKRGFKQVRKYSWQKTAQETLNLYQKALKEKRT